MACKLAMMAESRPYCMLATATTAQMARHFRFAQRDVSGRVAAELMRGGECGWLIGYRRARIISGGGDGILPSSWKTGNVGP